MLVRYGRDLNSVLKDNLGDSWEEVWLLSFQKNYPVSSMYLGRCLTWQCILSLIIAYHPCVQACVTLMTEMRMYELECLRFSQLLTHFLNSLITFQWLKASISLLAWKLSTMISCNWWKLTQDGIEAKLAAAIIWSPFPGGEWRTRSRPLKQLWKLWKMTHSSRRLFLPGEALSIFCFVITVGDLVPSQVCDRSHPIPPTFRFECSKLV